MAAQVPLQARKGLVDEIADRLTQAGKQHLRLALAQLCRRLDRRDAARQVTVPVLQRRDPRQTPRRMNSLAAEDHDPDLPELHLKPDLGHRHSGKRHDVDLESGDFETIEVAKNPRHRGRLDRREVIPRVRVDDETLAPEKMERGIGEDLALALRDVDGDADARCVRSSGGMVTEVVRAGQGNDRPGKLVNRFEPLAGARVDHDDASRADHGVHVAAVRVPENAGKDLVPA